MKYIIIFPLLLIFFNGFSQEKEIKKEKWHWNNNKAKQDTVAGYTQVLKVDNVLYISGAVTTDLTPEGVQSVYNDLKASLHSFGATFQNVVKENLYTTDIAEMKSLITFGKDFTRATFLLQPGYKYKDYIWLKRNWKLS